MTPKQEVDALMTVLVRIIESAEDTISIGPDDTAIVSSKALDRARRVIRQIAPKLLIGLLLCVAIGLSACNSITTPTTIGIVCADHPGQCVPIDPARQEGR